MSATAIRVRRASLFAPLSESTAFLLPEMNLSFILFISCILSVACYRSDIPKFKVGSHTSGKTSPHCPCEEVNSTYSLSCGTLPKVSSISIPFNGTNFGEFPWQVAITEKYEEEFLCSGILVSQRIVLTAARCIQDVPTSHLSIRLGEWDILSEKKNPFETYESLEIEVSKKYLNPDSSSTSDMHGANEDNNLAILKMVRPVSFEEYPHITPVCLPMFMNSKANLSDCMIAGWSSSKVVTLIEFIETYLDYADPEHRGVKSLLLSSSCPKDKHGRNCDVHHDSQHKSSESLPIEIMLQEVDEISAQIKVKLEENAATEEGEKIYSEKPVIYSRVLQKSAAKVLSHSDCSKLLKQLNATSPRPSQMCVLPQDSLHPCVGDVGSPVICKLVEEKKKSAKEGSIEDIAPKYAVVGIITQSYSCSEMDQKTSTLYPLLASSISKSLDHICNAITSSFKKTKIGSFKIQSLRQS